MVSCVLSLADKVTLGQIRLLMTGMEDYNDNTAMRNPAYTTHYCIYLNHYLAFENSLGRGSQGNNAKKYSTHSSVLLDVTCILLYHSSLPYPRNYKFESG